MDSGQIICQQLPAGRNHLRVAVVTETYPPEVNGVAMTIGRMVAGLQARQHQVQLIRPRQHPDDNPAVGPGFEEVLQRGLSIPRYDSLKMGLPARQALLKLWSLARPDVVHLVTEGPLGWSALSAALKLKIPCSSDFHTNFQSYSRHYGIGWLRKPIVAYLRKFHNRAGSTMVPTTAMRDELALHGYRNLRVVARGVDTRLFEPAKRCAELRRAWGATDAALVAMYVGRIAPEKNLPVLVQAFREIKRTQPQAVCVLVGDGPERAGLQTAHPDFIFAGSRHGDDLAAHYASGDVFLFASTTETFGNVTLEAMASGLAVVAYNYAAAAECIEHGRDGVVADYDNGADFITLAASLAADRSRIERLRRAARVSALKLDWETVHDKFVAALDETITSRHERSELKLQLSA